MTATTYGMRETRFTNAMAIAFRPVLRWKPLGMAVAIRALHGSHAQIN